MSKRKKEAAQIYQNLDDKNFSIITGDAINKIKLLKDNSVKLMYGSPPYPNAKRNYRMWKNDDYSLNRVYQVEIITKGGY